MKKHSEKRTAEQCNTKKVTQNAKHNRKGSQGDKISEKNKGTKGKQESKPARKDRPDVLRKNQKRTEQNEGNGSIKKKECTKRTAAQQDEIKTEGTKDTKV